MQPCLPVPKVRHFSPAPRGWIVSGLGPWQVCLPLANIGPPNRPKPRGGASRWRTTVTSRNCANWIETGMAETTEKTGEKKLSVAATKTLTLKGRGVEQGVVRQSFSHGRSKAVVVEKVKSRVPTRAKADTAAPAAAAKRPAAGKAAAAAATAAPSPVPAAPPPKPTGGLVLRSLTEEEQKARVHALNDARLREAEERKIAEEEAFIRKSREAAERAEREAAEARKADEDKRRKQELETKVKAEQEAKKRFGEDTAARSAAARPAL